MCDAESGGELRGCCQQRALPAGIACGNGRAAIADSESCVRALHRPHVWCPTRRFVANLGKNCACRDSVVRRGTRCYSQHSRSPLHDRLKTVGCAGSISASSERVASIDAVRREVNRPRIETVHNFLKQSDGPRSFRWGAERGGICSTSLRCRWAW